MAGSITTDNITFNVQRDTNRNKVEVTGNSFLGRTVQTKSVASNVSYGTVAHSDPFAITAIDLALTTKYDNSEFLVSARIGSNDTTSTNFGVGMGSQFSLNGGVDWTYITYPPNHEEYFAGVLDSYIVSRFTRLTNGEIQVPADTTIVFRIVVRFNSSNGIFFGGNGDPYNSLEQIVQEIRK